MIISLINLWKLFHLQTLTLHHFTWYIFGFVPMFEIKSSHFFVSFFDKIAIWLVSVSKLNAKKKYFKTIHKTHISPNYLTFARSNSLHCSSQITHLPPYITTTNIIRVIIIRITISPMHEHACSIFRQVVPLVRVEIFIRVWVAVVGHIIIHIIDRTRQQCSDIRRHRVQVRWQAQLQRVANKRIWLSIICRKTWQNVNFFRYLQQWDLSKVVKLCEI